MTSAPRIDDPVPAVVLTQQPQPGVATASTASANVAPPEPTADQDTVPLADVNAVAAAALKKQARICKAGRPIDDTIANRRVVFFYTLVVSAGAGTIEEVNRVDDDLEDDRLLRCLLARAGETRFSAKGAVDVRRKQQASFALRDLTP
jgi:hypothetical protein